jgi:hypothetical protein
MLTATRTFATAVLVSITLMSGPSNAQPYGPGPGFMMGPGMMDAGSFARMCGPASAGLAEWQAERLQHLVNPTEAQRAKLDDLRQLRRRLLISCEAPAPPITPALSSLAWTGWKSEPTRLCRRSKSSGQRWMHSTRA